MSLHSSERPVTRNPLASHKIIKSHNNDFGVKRWLKIIRLVNMHKHLGHALAQSSLAAVLRALKTSAQVPGTQHLLRSCAMVLRLFVHTDETQSLFLAFDLYIIII